MSHLDVLRLLISVGITVVALILSLLSAFVYVRERERRLLIVTVAYGLIFAEEDIRERSGRAWHPRA